MLNFSNLQYNKPIPKVSLKNDILFCNVIWWTAPIQPMCLAVKVLIEVITLRVLPKGSSFYYIFVLFSGELKFPARLATPSRVRNEKFSEKSEIPQNVIFSIKMILVITKMTDLSCPPSWSSWSNCVASHFSATSCENYFTKRYCPTFKRD